jgi:hypothetical protein
MADKKITQLPSASVATGSNVLPIVQDGATEQITVTNLGQGILNLGLSMTGSLQGTASVAFGITASATAGNAAHNVLFQDTAGSSLVNWDAGLRYNPSSNILTTTASFASNAGLLDGKDSSQFSNKVTGSWTLATGSNTVSFTVTPGGTYSMWVNGNIANGIVTWNATVTTSNENVAVVGSQYGWYYLVGNALVLTSIPSQIVGENGIIVTTSPTTTTSNVFTFGITNNSGAPQTVDYGYIKL